MPAKKKKATKNNLCQVCRVGSPKKEHGGVMYCATCWNQNFIIRAVELPILGPVDREWKELREALQRVWKHSTALANWAVHILLSRDSVRMPSQKKMPKLEKFDLYNYGFAKRYYPERDFWNKATKSASCILRRIQSMYPKWRFDSLWRQAKQLPLFRFPYPFPVHGVAWKASWSEDDSKRPLITMNFNGETWTLRLKGGPEFARQRARFAQIISGEAKQCEAAVYKKRDQEFVKVVGWFPRKEQKELDGVMLARTDKEAFIVAESDGKSSRIMKPFIINGGQARRWQAQHKYYRQRMSEDMKYEKRYPKRVRQHMNESLKKRCDKNNDRIKTFCQQQAASLAKFAERQRIAEVNFDGTPRGYLDSFPWHQFKTCLQTALDGAGIQFTDITPKSDEGE